MKKIFLKILSVFFLMCMLVFSIDIAGRAEDNDKPKVSIIVPVYNVEKWLPECMESLINQTLEDIEIICIDDGSSDGSGKILDEYAEKDKEKFKRERIKVIHQENQGVSAARNAGLDISSGEYITFVDPDDFIHPLTYEHTYNCAKKDNSDILEFKNMVFNDGDNHHFLSLFRNKDKNKDIDFSLGKNIHWKSYLYKFNVCVWCHLYKLDMINKYNIRFPVGITPGEDDCFNFIALVGTKKITVIPAVLYHYRLRAGSTMNTLTKEKFEDSRVNLVSHIICGWKSKNVLNNNSFFLLPRLLSWIGSISNKNNAKKILNAFGDYVYNEKIFKNCSRKARKIITKLKLVDNEKAIRNCYEKVRRIIAKLKLVDEDSGKIKHVA